MNPETPKPYWERLRSLEPSLAEKETWRFVDGARVTSYDLRVDYGKPLDAFSLKRKMLQDFEETRIRLRKENEALFSSGDLEEVRLCPVCGSETDFSQIETVIYTAPYIVCRHCTHRYVARRPSANALKAFYAENENYQAVYADPGQLEERIQKVVRPKLDWVVKAYGQRYGKPPKTILDVGAGSGHFVAAARQAGYLAEGVELSKSGVAFAQKNFGIEMHCLDFLQAKDSLGRYDVITFWGCLEHLSAPMNFLEVSLEKMSAHGMIFVEIPRWFSLSTASQRIFPDRVIRHLVPSAHIHMFTDSSLATALVSAGFSPAAAWYFGMDVYETAVLLASTAQERGVPDLSAFAPHAQNFQTLCDQNYLSDFMVLAGFPA